MKFLSNAISVNLCLAVIVFLTACGDEGRFAVSFPESLNEEPLDGRLLILISDNTENEPRFQIQDGPNTQLVFGIDVDGLEPEKEAHVGDTVFGYPLKSMADIPAGEYYVQALLHKYETFNLANGYTVKLPMDQGEGQVWNRSPGNLYSIPQKITFDPENDETFHIVMDQEIPPIEKPEDTKYIKHTTMQSDLLTEFWGRPMYLGANILLPEGFNEHPEARYAICIYLGHDP